MFSVNVKDSAAVKYPAAGSDGRTLKFYADFTFSVNHTYYVIMDPGWLQFLHAANLRWVGLVDDHFQSSSRLLQAGSSLFLAGVAVGTEFCNAESPALRDKTAWVVTVREGMQCTSFCIATIPK